MINLTITQQKKPLRPDELPGIERNPEFNPIKEPEPYTPGKDPEIIPEREPLSPNMPREVPDSPEEI